MISILPGVIRQLMRHKWRTFMIALSVTIGVMSVAVIDIIGDAGIVKFNNELDCLGISGISVSIKSKSGVEPLDSRDVKLIKSIENVESAMGIIKTMGSVSNHSEEISAAVVGIGENAKDTISLELKEGRYITEDDIMSYSNVCLIDESLSIDLFGTGESVGMKVGLNSQAVAGSYEIIGVIPTEGSILRNVADDMIDNSIYIPYSKIDSSFSSIAVSVLDTSSSDTTTSKIKRIVGYEKGNKNAINATDMATHRKRINRLLDIIKQILVVISATSIVVSALSIMTIMLLTVKERTYEIGIKKSIGASNRRVLAEIIYESGTIAFIGGVIGVTISLILSVVISAILGMSMTLNPLKLILLIAVSVLVGCISGAYPAITAAKLNPVDALGRN